MTVKVANKVETSSTVFQPKKYNVVFHNDNKTTMEFVMQLLVYIYDYDASSAYNTMMEVHERGAKIVGSYTKEIAESKQSKSVQLAINNGYPDFKVTVEES
ncbi:hypothetical protein RVBP17_1690 [Pseudomonas phage sp. 30-3]|uniref:ATP-dependent Clp protease adapter protein n=1 Tax=Pseudomonas phage vB_PaeM_PA5oct TaxID=2163605 RepID=A0A4Y1LUS5_9CAUD|nr:ATP-dependent protease [Pseudomonas phage vB_PaeM_PA5oct]WMI31804.1 ATP-dependent Clp protease adapter protein [Pseudomonas phage Callisto]WPK38734.1 ATP-dependent protease [Pseudomonas phage Cassandra]WPK39255.1 ATP-dependent protease [Pseudomonas phage Deifobo]WPK39767.1 ATP-dependent protease [Pseudomonas phage Ettore]WPK40288.1 ATP-dependent protease [Pseudomonas phage Paride]VOH54104.1 ATP-dependent Clp protease adapter protein ClpS [Pseudomonas phage vB_PaeM_MIJ3]BDR25788.1 hypothet